MTQVMTWPTRPRVPLADDDVRAAAAERQRLGKDPRARVLGVDDLLELLEARAAAAAAEAEALGVPRVRAAAGRLLLALLLRCAGWVHATCSRARAITRTCNAFDTAQLPRPPQ